MIRVALIVFLCALCFDFCSSSYNIELLRYEHDLQIISEHICPGINRRPVKTLSFIDEEAWFFPPEAIGVSYRCWFGYMCSVSISSQFWSDASERQRLALLAHELGHAWFDIDHVNDDGRIMSELLDPLIDFNTEVILFYTEECLRQSKRPTNFKLE